MAKEKIIKKEEKSNSISPEKMQALQNAMKNIDKAFGKGSLMRLGDKEETNIESISTGSLGLDLALGINGIPKGRIIEIYGPESSGKTTLTLHIVAEAQRQGGVCAFIDAEHALDVKYAKNLGVDTDNLLVSQPDCINLEELILTPKGYIKLKKISNITNVNSISKNLKLDTTETPSNIMYSNKTGYKLRTSKSEMIVSGEHRIKTFNGWKKIKELTIKDKIETIYKHNMFNKTNETSLNYKQSFILGCFIADGTYKKTPRHYGIDKILNDQIESYIKEEFKEIKISKYGISTTYSKEIRNSHLKSELGSFIYKYLGKVSGQEKFIPAEIFAAGEENLKHFLAGLWMCDGCVEKNKRLSYSSSVKEIIYNIGAILNYFNIPYDLRTKIKKEKFVNYEILVNSKEGIEFFQKEIPLISYKKELLDSIDLNKKESFVRFPKDMWGLIFSEINKKYGSTKDFYNILFNTNKDKHTFNTKRGLSDEYIKKINSVLKSEIIQKYIDSDILYSNILEISKTNKKYEMLDMTMNKNHNFIVNNSIVHNCGEQGLEITETLAKSGAVDIIIIDSVAALTPKAEIEGDMGDSHMGLQARLMSQALRKLAGLLNKTNTTVIFINQIRQKIGGMSYGNNETTTGGNALKFYASVRIDIRKIQSLKQGEEVIGNRVKAKVIKNKVAPPFRLAEFDVMFGKGISKSGEIIDYGVKLDIIDKAGSWFSYGSTKLGQGRESVKSYLESNPEIFQEIINKIKKKIAEDSEILATFNENEIDDGEAE